MLNLHPPKLIELSIGDLGLVGSDEVLIVVNTTLMYSNHCITHPNIYQIAHRFYYDSYDESHYPMELFPCAKHDVNNFLVSYYPTRSLVIQKSYKPKWDY